MHTQTLLAAYGCLLHDFGKMVYRAGGGTGSHSFQGFRALGEKLTAPCWKPVLDCLRWHHAADLRRDTPPAGHPAYIACAADNLSAAADRRETEGEGGTFLRSLPLSPIFSHMNGEHGGFSLPPLPQDGRLRMPRPDTAAIPPERYADAVREILAAFPGEEPAECWLGSLLTLLEGWTSAFPSSTFSGESPDISLYDHLKTTAAIGSCISEYLLHQGETDLRRRLFEEEKAFREEPTFLLYSADLSGIQRFIYTVSDAGALRSLRSRSFFLGLLMEHYLDELLRGCGLSRANLLYSGGGHCYLLLPNTPAVIQLLKDFNLKFNDYLLDQYGASLFLAHGWTACCGNDLINHPAEQAPYKEMFRRVSSAISAHKMHRYTAQQLLRLSRREEGGGQRECRICGRTDRLDGDLCVHCRQFVDLSAFIQRQDVYLVTTADPGDANFSLPALEGEAFFTFTDEKTARTRLKTGVPVLRVYTKNKSCTGFQYSTRIYVGDYAADNLMDRLADQSEGIRRIAVCRMDVDNLGQAFVAGFEQGDADPVRRYRYVTLSRTAAFSRQMSLFFQLYVNDLLSGRFEEQTALAVSIVYSGGDDVFLVGAWNDVITAANRIQSAFTRFTCGALTISGGIGLFDEHFPIRAAAAETARLEDRAKDEPGKNALSLFDPRESHTYSWTVFREKILEQKEAALQRFFDEEEERGNAFLYQLMALLRQAQEPGGRINLARYAYLLARLEPRRNTPAFERYRVFAGQMYDWALDPASRGQLITAIYLYVYRNRRVKHDPEK